MILRERTFWFCFYIVTILAMRPVVAWRILSSRPWAWRCGLQTSATSSSNIPALYTRTTTEKNVIASNQTVATNLTIGQEVRLKVVQFGPLGASVLVEANQARGLISQEEIWRYREKNNNKDIVLNEELTAYVGRIREDGKISFSLRPIGSARYKEAREIVQEALEGSPSGSIPVGDKSTPEDIASYFHGMSKADFKAAVGSLYRDVIAQPGAFFTTLITESERIARLSSSTASKPVAKTSSQTSIFIGNMANTVTEENLRKLVATRLGIDDENKQDSPIRSIRLVFDKGSRIPKGYGYVEFIDKAWQTKALEAMRGIQMNGRNLRVDVATPFTRDSKSTNPSSANTNESSQKDPESTLASKPWTKAPPSTRSDASSSRKQFVKSSKSQLLKSFDSNQS